MPQGSTGVFLTDFGLAKDCTTGSRFTRTGATLGTPHYMSPEQARGELNSLTAASDVWALGCVLYECLAGRRAFEGEHAAATIGAVLTGEPPVPAGVPAHAWMLTAAALQKHVEQRHATAATFRADAQRVLAGTAPAKRAPRFRWRWLAGLGAAAGAVTVVAALSIDRPPATAPLRPRSAGDELTDARLAAAWKTRRSAPQDALALIRRALERDPSRPEWQIRLGLLLWELGRNEEARLAWTAVADVRPDYADAHLHLGLEAFFRLGSDGYEAGEALPHFQRAAGAPGPEGELARAALLVLRSQWAAARGALRELDGWAAALVRARVETYDPDGDPAAALQDLRRALAEGVEFAWAYYERGTLKDDLGDLRGAIDDYRRALDLNPRDPDAWNNLGIANARLGDHSEALAAFTEALALRPGWPRIHLNRGNVRSDAGDYAGALEDFARALEAEPDNATVIHGRALVRMRQGHWSAALPDLDRAVELAPTWLKPRANRGTVLQSLGRFEEAIREFTHVATVTPDDPGVYFNRGNAHLARGAPADAIVDYERALALDPGNPSVLANRGDAHAHSGRLDLAIADYDRSLRLRPGRPAVLSNRGRCHLALGNHAAAEADFHAAVEIWPDDPAIRFNRALARHALGDGEGAVADLARALALAPPEWPYRARASALLTRLRALGG